MKSIKSLDLKTGVSHIRQICDDNRQRKERLPFFFLVGAGISHPPIPLASRIEEHCKAVAEKYGRGDELSGGSPIETYSHWFEKAYPNPVQRQRYLRELIDGKFISHTNFRLAHLLLDTTVTNLVVTPNFDDHLSRALTLFGKSHIVCDHPKTVERIDSERDDLQIVHVHGIYWFYDCCNLKDEIEERSRDSVETAFTMASLLDNVLSFRSPLVIGYSGWEGDVIMAALKRRLQNRLPYNLYWFCYRSSTPDSLPDWLKFHPDVYFVLPSPAAQPKSGKKVTLDKESRDPTLSGQEVLDELIRTFELRAPKLTTEPLEFLAEHLRHSLLQEHAEGVESDTYLISSVIARIERANKREKRAKQEIERHLEKVRDALRRSQYREAIQYADGISIDDLSETQRRELMNAMWTAASNLYDDAENELRGYDLVIALGEALSELAGDEDIQIILARALIDKGFVFDGLERHDEEISVYNDVEKRFGTATNPVLLELVVRTLVNKGITLSELNRSAEAIAVLDEVVKRFGEATEPGLREEVARALVAKGYTLGELHRSKEEMDVYHEVVRRFSGIAEPALLAWVADALNNIGFQTLCEAKQTWANGDAPSAREQLFKAQENLAAALERVPEDPVILGNQSYVAFLLGNKDEAHTLLARAISLGGEEVRQDELEVVDIHPLPQDEEFSALVRSIPASTAKES